MTPATLPDPVSRDELRSLLDGEAAHYLSIYFPTTRRAVGPEENSLHLKELLREARVQLEPRGLRRSEMDSFLRPLSALLENHTFWLHQLEGIALFRSDEEFRHYRLGVGVPKIVYTGSAPYIKPLLPALSSGGRWLVLALSQNMVRLLDCSMFDATEVDLPGTDIPRSLDEALRYDVLQKPELQHHPTGGPGRSAEGQAAPPEGPGGRRQGFHGHGESGEDHKTQIRRYFQAVDAGLYKLIGPDGPPIVLAGVDYLLALYREVSDLHSILTGSVEGNPDRLSDGDLHRQAQPIMEARVRERLAENRDNFGRLEARGLGSSDLADVLEAAHQGRIEMLMLNKEACRWGLFDAATRSLEERGQPEPADVDLLDLAARQAFLHGAAVYAVDEEQMVDAAHVAAVFRY